MRRLILTASLTGLVLALWASAALAVPGAWADVDDDASEVEVGASDDVTDGAGDSVGSGGCSWSAVSPEEVDVIWGLIGSSESDVAPGSEGIVDPLEYDWYWRSCPDAGTSDLIPVPKDQPPVDPGILRDEAVDRLALPGPAVGMNPPDDQVVHIGSWLWIDGAMWQTHSRSVTAGGVTATVRATPRRVVWDMGNGDTVVCDGPGTPYDTSRLAAEQSTDCSYTYRHSSADQPDEAYQVTATVEWEATWSVTGAAGGGPLPAMFTTAPVSVRVAEMQALNQ